MAQTPYTSDIDSARAGSRGFCSFTRLIIADLYYVPHQLLGCSTTPAEWPIVNGMIGRSPTGSKLRFKLYTILRPPHIG